MYMLSICVEGGGGVYARVCVWICSWVMYTFVCTSVYVYILPEPTSLNSCNPWISVCFLFIPHKKKMIPSQVYY